MNKQKLSGIIMIPVVAIALFVAWKSYKASLPESAPENPVSSKNAGMPGGGGAPGSGGGGGGQQRGPTPAQMVDNMAKELTLNDSQKTQILAIEEDLAAKRKALPKEMSREDRRKQSTANRAEAETKIKAILTPEQQPKYDEMQAKRRAQMQAMRQQGGGAPGGGGMGGSGGGAPKMMGGPGGGKPGPEGGAGAAPAKPGA